MEENIHEEKLIISQDLSRDKNIINTENPVQTKNKTWSEYNLLEFLIGFLWFPLVVFITKMSFLAPYVYYLFFVFLVAILFTYKSKRKYLAMGMMSFIVCAPVIIAVYVVYAFFDAVQRGVFH